MNFRTVLILTVASQFAVPTVWSEQIGLDRTYDVATGGRLSVRADGGNISVSGTDLPRVVVKIVARGSRSVLDHMTLTADQSGNDVSVTATRRGRTAWLHWFGSGGDADVDITIAVPRQYHVHLETSGGDIAVSRVQGTAEGKTSGGDVRIEDVQGHVSFKSSGGNMNVAAVRGPVEVATSGGNVVARSVTGDLQAYSSGGDINAETVSGGVKLRTTGGNVAAGGVVGPIDAHTSGGDVRLSRIDGAIKARSSGGDVRVELIGANRGIDVATSGGEIVIQVAPTVSATLDATSSGGRINTELPVTTTSSGESHLSGTINGGGQAISARTSGGNIQLRARAVPDQPLERS